MASVNKVILVGYLGMDPDVKHTAAGKAVAELRLATSFGTGDNSETEWHRLVMWEKLAETAGKFLKKGSQIYIEGRIKTRQYEDKEGVTKYVTEIVVSSLTMLGSSTSKPDSLADDPDAGGQVRASKTRTSKSKPSRAEDDGDNGLFGRDDDAF